MHYFSQKFTGVPGRTQLRYTRVRRTRNTLNIPSTQYYIIFEQ